MRTLFHFLKDGSEDMNESYNKLRVSLKKRGLPFFFIKITIVILLLLPILSYFF
jgi:hypothetical protein